MDLNWGESILCTPEATDSTVGEFTAFPQILTGGLELLKSYLSLAEFYMKDANTVYAYSPLTMAKPTCYCRSDQVFFLSFQPSSVEIRGPQPKAGERDVVSYSSQK